MSQPLVRYHGEIRYKNGQTGAWFVRPDCDCTGLYLQAVDTGDQNCKAFTKTGQDDSPTFSPSVFPYDCQRYDKDNPARCHFFINNGVAEHCQDSRFPNAKRPLLPVDGNFIGSLKTATKP